MATPNWRTHLKEELSKLPLANGNWTGRGQGLKNICELCDGAPQGARCEELKLIHALAARAYVVEDLSPSTSRDHYESVFLGYQPSDPKEVPAKYTTAAAALLYEHKSYSVAAQLFSRAIEAQPNDPRLKFLLAYTYEGLGRLDQNPGAIERGLSIIEDVAADHLLAAEQLHCRGHLLLARASVGKTNRTRDRRHATQNLKQASDAFPGYLSCYTSSFAEIGYYELAIQRSEEALNRPVELFAPLERKQCETVRAEINFYLAYALSCTNDYDRAEKLLITFSDSMHQLKRQDAESHGHLFLIKNRLKRLRFSESNAKLLSDIHHGLKRLSFLHWSRSAVLDEKSRYEMILEFLSALDQLAATNQEHLLGTTVGHALVVVEKLRGHLETLVQAPLVSLLSSDDNLLNRLRQQELRHGQLPAGLMDNLNLAAVQATGKPEISGDFVVLVADKLSQIHSVLSYIAANRFVIALVNNVDHDTTAWPRLRCFVTQGAGRAYQYMIIGMVTALIKRFLVADEYVFALSPCEESPALQYQKPDQYLHLPKDVLL